MQISFHFYQQAFSHKILCISNVLFAVLTNIRIEIGSTTGQLTGGLLICVVAFSLCVLKRSSTAKFLLVSFLGSLSGSLHVYSAGNKPTPGSVCVINFFRHLPAVQQSPPVLPPRYGVSSCIHSKSLYVL